MALDLTPVNRKWLDKLKKAYNDANDSYESENGSAAHSIREASDRVSARRAYKKAVHEHPDMKSELKAEYEQVKTDRRRDAYEEREKTRTGRFFNKFHNGAFYIFKGVLMDGIIKNAVNVPKSAYRSIKQSYNEFNNERLLNKALAQYENGEGQEEYVSALQKIRALYDPSRKYSTSTVDRFEKDNIREQFEALDNMFGEYKLFDAVSDAEDSVSAVADSIENEANEVYQQSDLPVDNKPAANAVSSEEIVNEKSDKEETAAKDEVSEPDVKPASKPGISLRKFISSCSHNKEYLKDKNIYEASKAKRRNQSWDINEFMKDTTADEIFDALVLNPSEENAVYKGAFYAESEPSDIDGFDGTFHYFVGAEDDFQFCIFEPEDESSPKVMYEASPLTVLRAHINNYKNAKSSEQTEECRSMPFAQYSRFKTHTLEYLMDNAEMVYSGHADDKASDRICVFCDKNVPTQIFYFEHNKQFNNWSLHIPDYGILSLDEARSADRDFTGSGYIPDRTFEESYTGRPGYEQTAAPMAERVEKIAETKETVKQDLDTRVEQMHDLSNALHLIAERIANGKYDDIKDIQSDIVSAVTAQPETFVKKETADVPVPAVVTQPVETKGVSCEI